MKYFFSFHERIDPKIKYIISMKGIKTVPLVLQLRHSIDNPTKRKLARVGFKTKYEINFLKCICGSLPTRNFDSLKALVEITRIYYDDKIQLTGKILTPSENAACPIVLKSQLLCGRGVSIGFIDTGVRPNDPLVRGRKRIKDFRDFLQNKRDPYDDSGHGTASIAVSSIPAPEAGIVCAKAFDISDHGFYSDIIAAMDWILSLKDDYNIKIVVLNFGAPFKHKSPDILVIAADALWDNGLLVVSCAGNLGPESATITSPGCSHKLLTIGALDTAGNEKLSVSHWSSRGPTEGADKPDMAMPGHIPSEGFMGTAVSASLASGFAALLYEKKQNLSPDDAKSLLKLCCTSLGELKHSQGKGHMDVKKIEEI